MLLPLTASDKMPGGQAIPPREEQKIVRALDLRMTVLLAVFYLTNFLDRVSIGNAKIAGIQTDLHLSDAQMGTVISIFYVTYILFEIPANLLLKKKVGCRLLAYAMFTWSLITIGTAFAKNFATLIAMRILLGIVESCYIPGVLYHLSRFYKPDEIALRVGFIICAGFTAMVVSGPIAYGTSYLEGHHGLHGWQYLFLIEGCVSIALSFVAYYCLFDSVEHVTWLTSQQKEWQMLRMQHNKEDTQVVRWVDVRSAITSWKTWAFSLMYFFNAEVLTSISVFTPTVIHGFGFSVVVSQILSSPSSVIGVFLSLLAGYLTDRYHYRAMFACSGFATISVGWLLLLILDGRVEQYCMLIVIGIGLAIQAAPLLSWPTVSFPNMTQRAVAIALVAMAGNGGSILASYIYPFSDNPNYVMGKSISLGCSLAGTLMAITTGYILHRQDRENLKEPVHP